MTVSRTILVCAVSISVLWGGVGLVFGQPSNEGHLTLETLSARFLSQIEALNAGQLNAAVAAAHEDVVVYGLYSPFPIEGKNAYRQAVKEYFDEHERAVLEIVYPKYRITGQTGVAWGNYQLTTQLKGESVTAIPGQYMLTYAYIGEAWVVISMHFAPLPQ